MINECLLSFFRRVQFEIENCRDFEPLVRVKYAMVLAIINDIE